MTDKKVMEYICDRARHLICLPYSVGNLHMMAANLNIHRCWYNRKPYAHYDIPQRRIEEITAKCRVVSSKQIVAEIHAAEGKERNLPL